jgi:lipopolysaccharide export LptBFGC system permease protein LptF
LIGGILFDAAGLTTRQVAFFFAIMMCVSTLWSFVYFIVFVNPHHVSQKYKLFEFANEQKSLVTQKQSQLPPSPPPSQGQESDDDKESLTHPFSNS